MIFLVVAALTFIAGLNMFAYLSSQVSITAVVRLYFSHTNQARYVSLSTNAITGAHTLCLFVVTAWFIYRLKHSIGVVVKRELMVLTSVLCFPISVPILWILWQRDSEPGIYHLRRNICWHVQTRSFQTLKADATL